jgi:hypothetical protein
MQVDDYIRKSVVFLGMPEAHGFVGHGTGFLIAIDEGEHSFFYVISARHVVWPLWVQVKDGKPQGQIFVRVNRDTGVPKVFPVQRDEWIFHPDKEIDVCALPLDLHTDESEHDGEKLDWSHIALPSMAHTHDKASWSGISLGDEVFVAGAFVNRLGVQKNIPIIRIGNIAAMPEESIEFVSPKRPVYLVETRSLGGISGFPVFLNLQSVRVRGKKSWGPVAEIPTDNPDRRKVKIIFPYLLIGMIIYLFGSKDPFDFPLTEEQRETALKDSEFNSGISAVMDVNDILDFLEMTPMKEPRLATMQRKNGNKP